ncbi:MAG: hypothetical protein PVJ31_03320 [Methyloceanibacter sp.]|jgi:hypothetical protein
MADDIDRMLKNELETLSDIADKTEEADTTNKLLQDQLEVLRHIQRNVAFITFIAGFVGVAFAIAFISGAWLDMPN